MVSLLLPNDDEILSKLSSIRKLGISSKSEMVNYDPYKALMFLKQHTNMAMVKGYLVAYLVDKPWYSNERVLCEMLVLRMCPTGTLRDVIEFFEREAKVLDCNRIVTGTLLATNDQALVRLYQRQGFTLSACQLSKEIS